MSDNLLLIMLILSDIGKVSIVQEFENLTHFNAIIGICLSKLLLQPLP